MVYGRNPPTISSYTPGASNIEVVESMLTDRDTIIQLLQTNLTKAQQKMKQQADKHHVEVSLDIGERASLKLRSYRRLSAKKICTQKLSKCYYGAFQILDKVGPVA